MNIKPKWNLVSFLTAFIIGVIMFWSIGKGWLNLQSSPILFAGLVGVALAVLAFALWDIYDHLHKKEK